MEFCGEGCKGLGGLFWGLFIMWDFVHCFVVLECGLYVDVVVDLDMRVFGEGSTVQIGLVADTGLLVA